MAGTPFRACAVGQWPEPGPTTRPPPPAVRIADMTSSSLEAAGFAVVLAAIAIAALVALVRRPRRPHPGGHDEKDGRRR